MQGNWESNSASCWLHSWTLTNLSISVSQSLLYSGLTKNMQFVVHLSLPLLGAHIATRVPAHRRGGDSEIGAFPWDPNRRRCLQVVSGRSAPNVADRYMQKPEGVADQSLSLSLSFQNFILLTECCRKRGPFSGFSLLYSITKIWILWRKKNTFPFTDRALFRPSITVLPRWHKICVPRTFADHRTVLAAV